jgi:hypothetical protein
MGVFRHRPAEKRELLAEIGITDMHIRYMIAGLLVAGAFAAPLHAQDTAKKPGGLNKIAHNVSKTMKKAGQDTKAEVHRDGTKTHQTLKKAGNDTKTATGNATGIHKIGGTVGEAAQDVSHAGKSVGRTTKHTVKKTAAAAHKESKDAGKDAKEAVKKP